MKSDNTAAEHDHLGRKYTRHAAEQDAATTVGRLQRRCCSLNGKASGNFRHRRQEGQAATIIGYGFICNSSDAGFQEPLVCSGSGAG